MKKKLLSLTLLTLLGLTACGGSEPTKTPSPSVTVSPTPSKEGSLSISLINAHRDSVTIRNEYQNAFFNLESFDYSNFTGEVLAYVNARSDIGNNLPITLSWNISFDGLGEEDIILKEVFIAEDGSELSDGLRFAVKDNSFDFYNYKLRTKYYYRVDVTTIDDVYSSDYGTFYTAQKDDDGNELPCFRTINVDGMTNFRDLGSFGHIKQGLVYRCSTYENNTCYSPAKTITEEGIDAINNELGMREEIDLRKPNEISEDYSGLVGVNYIKAPLYYGGKNILTYVGTSSGVSYDNPANIFTIFKEFTIEDNYPISFHCTRGADRTGCIAFLLMGLMGVEEEYIYRDYIFSNFYNINGSINFDAIENKNVPQTIEKYVNVLRNYNGDTLSEKINNYLVDVIGLTQDDVNTIKSILAE